MLVTVNKNVCTVIHHKINNCSNSLMSDLSRCSVFRKTKRRKTLYVKLNNRTPVKLRAVKSKHHISISDYVN